MMHAIAQEIDSTSFTLDMLLKVMERFKPPLYYVDDKHCPKVDDDDRPIYFLLPESDFTPETLVFHPDNWPAAIEAMADMDRPLRHLREWRPRPYLPMRIIDVDNTASLER